ncbi:MAG TPA: response regulator transcription factor [Pyrinomonadaceae bacterium]|nr:response regulator transcription factor [Pyrinomonadaceae bacterium]
MTGNNLDPIHVVLADDHALVRAGIRALLEKIDRVEVVGEAGDGERALELVQQLQPDVILLDIAMPGLSGFDVLKEINEKSPHVKVVILTVHDSEDYALHALRSGAEGYLPKSAASAELELALEHVMRGEKYLSPSIARKVVFEYLKGTHSGRAELAHLTPRQREVLTLISQGHSTKDIARILNISVKTVETHRAQLMERLDIHDVAGLVRYAIRTGMVKLDE